MSVTLQRVVRLRVMAGAAKPGPAIGQALGPLGLNMADFCKQFNEKTKLMEKDIPIPVSLSGTLFSTISSPLLSLYSNCFDMLIFGSTAFSNRTFTFKVKTPPVTWFLKRCAGIKKGAAK